MSKVVVYKALPKEALELLRSHHDVCYLPDLKTVNESFLTELKDAEGILGASVTLSESTLAHAPILRAISTISVGVDRFDIPALNQRRIPLMHTPGAVTETTADTAMLLMLMSARRAVEMSDLVRLGLWRSSITPDHFGFDIHGKTLGIIGMGRIGQAVAKRAHAGFNMKVMYYNRSKNKQAEQQSSALKVDLDTLLINSDFICVLLPYNEQTHHFIGRDEFQKMKSSAIFVNISRGKVVNEKALVAALEERDIYSAGLDVFEVEPLPVESPLITMKNVTLLPHIGSATHDTRYNMAMMATKNLINAMAGNIEQHCFNVDTIK